jgi:ribosome maturation factor RimP
VDTQKALMALIEPEAIALGFNLVRVKLFGGDDQTLQIMAERPETRQLAIADCAALSRRVSEKLDALEEAGEDIIDGTYRLEVSSPGIDRPLTRVQDYADWAGHDAKITLDPPIDGRKTLYGVIRGLAGDSIELDERKSGLLKLEFAHIVSAKLVLTDRLIAQTAQISATGADDIEDEIPEDIREEG